MAAYHQLKASAKRRGKDFTITFEYFKQFAIETKYLTGKGKEKDSYTIDRIDNNKGYVPGNLQVLTNSQNVKKYLNYDWFTKTASVVVIKDSPDDGDLIF